MSKLKLRYVLPCAALLTATCSDDALREQREQKLVITGILIEGQKPAGIRVFTLNGLYEQVNEVTDATVHLQNGSTEVSLLWDGAGYSAQNNDLIPHTSGGIYTLTVEARGKLAIGTVEVPPSPELTDMSPNHFTVNPNEPDAAALTIDWSGGSNWRYVLSLKNLETSPQPLPFAEKGTFNDYYSTPLVQTFAVMQTDYFESYGHHLITIYSINRDYESVFYFQPNDQRNFLRQSPSNISGAYGYLAAAGLLQIDFWLDE